jgi:hypothetical protein
VGRWPVVANLLADLLLRQSSYQLWAK